MSTNLKKGAIFLKPWYDCRFFSSERSEEENSVWGNSSTIPMHNFIIALFPPFCLIVRGITSITIGGNFVAREHLNFRVRLTGRRCLLLFPFLLSSIYGIREKNWFPKKNLGATKLADFCDNMTIDDCDDGNAILDYLGNYDFQGVVHKVTDPKKKY